MLKYLSAFACVGTGVLLLGLWMSGPQDVASQPATHDDLVAGMPREQAEEILERHRSELKQIPGVHSLGLQNAGIIIQVIVQSQTRHIQPQALDNVTQQIPIAIEGLPVKIDALPVLPPPRGFIIMQPTEVDKKTKRCHPGFERAWSLDHFVCYERVEACPVGFDEVESFGWRYCLNPLEPLSIPALSEPPIAGVSFDEAQAILERHKEELRQLPGVGAIGLSAEGITIEVENAAALPSSIEGLPIKASPLPKGQRRAKNHSFGAAIRPLHGGLFLAHGGTFLTSGTLTGVALS